MATPELRGVSAICVCGKSVDGAPALDGTVTCGACGRKVVIDPAAAAKAFGTADATKTVDTLQDSTGKPFSLKLDENLTQSVDQPPAPLESPRLPDKLGPYRILGRLGQGGMGIVYKGHDETLDRSVALKVLARTRGNDEDAQLEREARAIAAVTHPNVVQVYSAGEQDKLAYFAMELVNGPDLREVLEREGPLTVARARRYMTQAALGLRAAAKKGIFHRDVKPANLLLDTRDDQVKVADFGLAKRACVDASMAGTSLIAGTPLYVAPEVIRNGHGDHRADIYSLGATFFHLLAGQPPFGGKSAAETLVGHATAPPPDVRTVRPDVPAGFAIPLHRCMSKEPEARYATYDQLLGELDPARAPSDSGPVVHLRPAMPVTLSMPHAPPVPPVPPAPPRPVEIARFGAPAQGRSKGTPWPFVVAIVAVVGGLNFVAREARRHPRPALPPFPQAHAPLPVPSHVQDPEDLADCAFADLAEGLTQTGDVPAEAYSPLTVSEARTWALRRRLTFPGGVDTCPSSGLPYAICGRQSPVIAWHVHDLRSRSVVFADQDGDLHAEPLYDFLKELRDLNRRRGTKSWHDVVRAIRRFLPEDAGNELRRLENAQD